MTPAKLKPFRAADFQDAAPKCCTDAAQGGGLCLDHMSASSPHCGCRAALALAELMPVLDEWIDESCVLDDIDRTLHAAWTKAKESLS